MEVQPDGLTVGDVRILYLLLDLGPDCCMAGFVLF
jgi:hypothetical protein